LECVAGGPAVLPYDSGWTIVRKYEADRPVAGVVSGGRWKKSPLRTRTGIGLRRERRTGDNNGPRIQGDSRQNGPLWGVRIAFVVLNTPPATALEPVVKSLKRIGVYDLA